MCFVNRSVTIHNRSDVIVHYEWKAFATEEEEQMEKEMYCNTHTVIVATLYTL